MADALPQLTAHEKELLPKAVRFAKDHIKDHSTAPTVEQFRRYLRCRAQSAELLRKHVAAQVQYPVIPKKPELTEVNQINKDKWTIVLPKTNVHTLEQLLEYCEVDADVWEVERFDVNKWEMGFVKESVTTRIGKDKARKTYEADSRQLFQVKAILKRKAFKDLDAANTDNAKLRSQVEKLRVQLRSEKEIATRLAKNHAGYDDFLANIKEFVSVLGEFSLPQEKFSHAEPLIVPAVSKGHTEDAVLLLSDTHFGDRIRREDTSGFPEFDLTISGNRMGYVIRKAKQVLTLHRTMYPIKRLYIWIGGDIGNGDLHDAPKSNQLFLPAQVHFSYHMLKFAIEDLLALTVPDENGNVVVEEIVLLFTVGNHMRMDEKMPSKLQGQRTLDWLIYQFIIDKFATHPKVRIRAEMSPYIFETIRGHRHLFAHGMQVGYRNSPDAQCKSMAQFIDRVRALFDSPEWRRKNGLQGETFARVCIGDIHVPVSFPRLISNGSLNGQNELGVNWTLEPIPAGQQLFGVSEKHLETWKYFLECSQIQKDPGDFNSYGVFAEEYAGRIGR
jgi:hypothetical protein